MDKDLYDLLGMLGLGSQKMRKRRRLISLAWDMTAEKTPYKLDQLLTHGSIFTGLRILAIVIIFGYGEAEKLYPVLKEGGIPPPSEDVLRDESMRTDAFVPSDLGELEQFMETQEQDKLKESGIIEEEQE